MLVYFYVRYYLSDYPYKLEQIKDIYSGKVKNWKEVGGADDSIRAFQRPADSGSQTALENLMGDTTIMEAPSEDIATGMGGIINEVSQYKNFKNAIGYTFRFYSTEMVGNEKIHKVFHHEDLRYAELILKVLGYKDEEER